jgi:hypothetical protein
LRSAATSTDLRLPLDVGGDDVVLFDLGPRYDHVGALAVIGRCETLTELDGSRILARWRDAG